jgi:phosphoglycerol transferase
MIARPGRGRAAALLLYGGVALAACVGAVLVLRLWQADLRVPFNYRGDSVFFEMMVKAVIDHGWYLTNPQLGAPGVLALHDFPQADGIHLLLIKLVSAFSRDWALLFNIYYLLGFPLIALSSVAVLRHFGIAPGPAVAVSLLYAFLPSRLMIGELHFYLVAFYEVPLAVLLALWVAGDDPPLFAPAAGAGPWRPNLVLRRGRSIAAIAVALLISGTGVYYAFFAGVLILFSGALSAVGRRSPRHAFAAVAITALIVAGLGVQSIPTLLYHRAMGPNQAAANRPLVEAETYGLRIAPMLLPVRDHRIGALSAVSHRYEEGTAVPEEATSTNLGVVGAVGFLILLGRLFRRERAAAPDLETAQTSSVRSGVAGEREAVFAALARLNLAALLVATTGGFGALFALLVSPQIRTYARMHVYLAFFALFAVALLLDRLWRTRHRAGVVLTVAVTVLGLLDQTTPAMVPSYAKRARAYRADAAFVESLEAELPNGAQIFQLPYLRFPEGGPLPGTKLVDYDPLRPYLHSRALRWSYATMYGRPGDAWTSAVADEPAPDLVRVLSDVGFDGILVNRDGYADDGAAIVAALSAELGADSPAPLRATDRQVFFSLRAVNEKAFSSMAPADRERRRQQALNRPLLRWLERFFPPEHDGPAPFRWCPGDCAIEIDNPGEHDARVIVSMRVSAGQPPASLQVSGGLWNEAITLVPDGTLISRTLLVPPGRHRIRLRSDSAPVISARDPRRLVFRVDDARLRPADGASP